MQVDFKIEVWERVSVPSELEAEVLEAIKNGSITSSNDLIEMFDDCTYEGTILETAEQMLPIDNDGQSTLEVLNDKGETIFTNEDK